MNELRFETGLQTYSINGKAEVSFNATDSDFVERLYQVFERLDKKQSEYETQAQKLADKVKVFDFMRERDKEMRDDIDNLFGSPVCEAVFGRMNVFALASGLPVWCNLLLSIMDEIDTSFSREQKATNPRLKKYLAKYNKK